MSLLCHACLLRHRKYAQKKSVLTLHWGLRVQFVSVCHFGLKRSQLNLWQKSFFQGKKKRKEFYFCTFCIFSATPVEHHLWILWYTHVAYKYLSWAKEHVFFMCILFNASICVVALVFDSLEYSYLNDIFFWWGWEGMWKG